MRSKFLRLAFILTLAACSLGQQPAPRAGEIHHGADDNASGVAGLLELARCFASERAKLKHTLI